MKTQLSHNKTVFRGFASNGNDKTKVEMNNPIYLGLSILEIIKTLMYEFWYDYIKLKYQNNANFATWIQIALLFILKLKIFMKTLELRLKKS